MVPRLAMAELAACGLPQRWHGRTRFTVLDANLDDGQRLAALWAAWRADPRRCDRLHLIACHPADPRGSAAPPDVVRALVARGLPTHAIDSAWPSVLRGIHRIELVPDRVVLTLIFGRVEEVARTLRCQVDAFLLGRVAIAERRASSADDALARQLARLAASGATLAAASGSDSLRHALRHTGFTVTTPGSEGAAPDSRGPIEPIPAAVFTAAAPIAAVFAPRWTVRRRWLVDSGRPEMLGSPQAPRRAAVIGAGLAGTAAALALARRGWEVEVFEAGGEPAQQGSGNICGAFHPHVSLDDCTLSQLTRAGISALWREYDRLGAWGTAAASCGVLQVATDARGERTLHAAVAALAASRYACGLDRPASSAAASAAMAAGGAWFARAGWARPRALCNLRLGAAESIRLHTSVRIAALERLGAGWIVRDHTGGCRACVPVVVLANAHRAPVLGAGAGAGGMPIDRLRGQLSHLPASGFERLSCPIVGAGYLLPAVDGVCAAGVDYGGGDIGLTVASHARNLSRVASLFEKTDALHSSIAALDPQSLPGNVGFRTVTPDRLPVAGALIDAAALAGRRTAGTDDWQASPVWARPKLPGLFALTGYGSRGITWSSLMAEHLVALLEDEPSPLESSWADAVDPGRFSLAFRRGVTSE